MMVFLMYYFFIQKFIFRVFGIESRIKWQGFTDRTVFPMGRRMAKASEGYIGLVSAKTQPGNSVWLLKGGNVPFIPREDSNII